MMMAPTPMMGAEIIVVLLTATSVCTCCTSLVVRVMSGGRAELRHFAPGESHDAAEQRRAQITAEAHGSARTEVRGGDRESDLAQRS